jgi:hypothetical protein
MTCLLAALRAVTDDDIVKGAAQFKANIATEA